MSYYRDYDEIDANKILHQHILGSRVWSILQVKDWPIEIQNSVYRNFFAVVSWTAYDLKRPNHHEKFSAATKAICEDIEDALQVLERHTA